MRKIVVLSLALSLSCAVVASALAQGTSALRGVVVDEQGGVLPG